LKTGEELLLSKLTATEGPERSRGALEGLRAMRVMRVIRVMRVRVICHADDATHLDARIQ
jgi:hypothetical protein